MSDVISIYTREQAIEDGTLLRIGDYFADTGAIAGVVARWLNDNTGKFALGELVITANAAQTLPPRDVLVCLLRHKFGDWGDLDEDDRKANNLALLDGDSRIFSAYRVRDDVKVWIITEATREATTVLLPEDY